ncbi:MAG TPA: hypothetical protein QF802_02800 [Candidatus Thalassarchaeaceae archaeon]|nr:hypothetical protein [Candidatus Thalassarchaeaceae archaeon]
MIEMPLTIDSVNILHPDSTVTAVAISPDGKFLSWAEEGGVLKICDPEGGNKSEPHDIEGGVSHLAISPDGMVIVGSHSGDLHGHESLGGHRWSHHLGGGCDHLAVSPTGDLVAVIDGARLLHMLTSTGTLLTHYEAGELTHLAVDPRGDSAAITDDVGNVTVVGRDGNVRFTRPSRGETGERVTAMTYLADGHLCIAREALDVTMGDEDEIVIEWWTPMGQEAARVPLRQRCDVLRATNYGVACGMFDGEVIEFDSARNKKSLFKSPYSIHDLIICGNDLLVTSWFNAHMIDGDGEEKWQVEHTGLTKLVRTTKDGSLIMVAGDNQNDYTRENQIMVLDPNAKPYAIQAGADIDSDLAEFDDAPMAQNSDISAESLYGGDEDYSELLTKAEIAQLSRGKETTLGSDDLMGLLEAEITLTDETNQEEFDFESALADESSRINMPPVADAGDDQIVEADDTGAAIVTLDGSRSFDEDGEIVSHVWMDISNRVIGEAPVIKVKIPKGNHTFTLTVTDNDLASTSDAVTVQVR